jgi:hypothetical protein
LLQQLVDQRGLAVVDVGDDGDVAKIHGTAFQVLKERTGADRFRSGVREVCCVEMKMKMARGAPRDPGSRSRKTDQDPIELGQVMAAALFLWLPAISRTSGGLCPAAPRSERGV